MSANGEVKEHTFEMAHDGPRKPVVIAMDGSEHADYAFHCKFCYAEA